MKIQSSLEEEIVVGEGVIKLTLRGCFLLKKIVLPKTLQELEIISCLKLREIPKVDKLKRLHLDKTRINELPELEELEELYINVNFDIKRIPRLISLRQLTIAFTHIEKMEDLGESKKLDKLQIMSNYDLKRIEKNHAKEMEVAGCLNLEEIEIAERIKKLTIIRCNLKKIPLTKNLTKNLIYLGIGVEELAKIENI